MVDILLYASIACADADAIMLRINRQENLPKKVKIELVETIEEATPHCPWDAID